MMSFTKTHDMEDVDWEKDGKLAHLRTFIREGEIRNTTISTPAQDRFRLTHPHGKHKEYKIRHLGLQVQFNASDHGVIYIDQEAYFGDNVVLYASSSGISIGERIKMAQFSSIYASYHDTYDKEKIVYDEVVIGDDVWIAQGAVILKGVIIANNCTVGANAVVTKSFLEPYSVIGGNPAKLLYNARDRQ